MKKGFLICNSHLDPVWMWDFEEGIGAALSTFRQAAEFCDEYEYIFCHNEVLLYEYVRKYDKKLYEKIQRLVKEGKWKIMGGWYLQPDCHIPSGESFVRQCITGKRYFRKNFDSEVRVALNFDSFGHTVGLPQILKKCGYDGYLFCRPMPFMNNLPCDEFLWKGVDGSTVKAVRIPDKDLYCSQKGQARGDIERKLSDYRDKEYGIALWGVGNHGGNPSRKDLQEVNELIAEAGYPIVHSYPEEYFDVIQPTTVWDKSMLCHIGSHSSMHSVKKAHSELESALYATEKICTAAQMVGACDYDDAEMSKAEEILLTIEFHDILSGTSGIDGEASTLQKAAYAREVLKEQFNKAFFALTETQTKAMEGEYPIFVFNPMPYELDTVVEAEFLASGITSHEIQYKIVVKQGEEVLPSQIIKERSNIAYDRRKRIAFKAKLAPMGISRISFFTEIEKKTSIDRGYTGDLVYEDNVKKLVISRETGLLESFVIDGKELLKNAFSPVVYDDDADPWGWYRDKIGKTSTPCQPSNCQDGPFKGLKNVNIVERGEVLTEVECYFEYDRSFVKVGYKIYKDEPYIDVTLDVLWNQQQETLKLLLPYTQQTKNEFFGQIAYGTETFAKDRTEIAAQHFVSVGDSDGKTLALLSRDTYGYSAEGNDLYVTLMRGIAHCAHPISTFPLLDETRYVPYVEQGKHVFAFRLFYGDKSRLENEAILFNQGLYALNTFPHGNQTGFKDTVVLSDANVALTACRKTAEGIELRLFNNSADERTCALSVSERKTSVHLGKFEVKTLVYTPHGEFVEKTDFTK